MQLSSKEKLDNPFQAATIISIHLGIQGPALGYSKRNSVVPKVAKKAQD
jgi:hypothetical protein